MMSFCAWKKQVYELLWTFFFVCNFYMWSILELIPVDQEFLEKDELTLNQTVKVGLYVCHRH